VKPKLYLISILACVCFITACIERQAPPAAHVVKKYHLKKIKKDTVATSPDTVTITAVGDIMLGTSYPDGSKLPPDSAQSSFAAALPDLQYSDIVFGNLEGTLLDGGAPAAYKKKLATAYLFRMPTAFGQVLKDAGFNLLSVANNHITDFSTQGYISTTQTLDSLGIYYAGLEEHKDTVFNLKGVRYGFCAFAPNANTLPILDLKNTAQVVSDLKKQVDIVIVSFHGGAEGAAYEHVPPGSESFLGQKRGDVRAFAHTAVDAGADVVFGNGPHVNRGMERYKNHLIAYSLGNFCTYKSVSVDGVCGLSSLLKVYLNKKGEFLNGQIIALKQTHAGGLQRDSLNKVITRMQVLTKVDFLNPGLMIADDGQITESIN